MKIKIVPPILIGIVNLKELKPFCLYNIEATPTHPADGMDKGCAVVCLPGQLNDPAVLLSLETGHTYRIDAMFNGWKFRLLGKVNLSCSLAGE